MTSSRTFSTGTRPPWFHLGLLALLGAGLFLFWPRPVQETPLHIYLTEPETVVFEGPALPPDAQVVWDREFSEARFFSAFAVSENGRWGWALDRHSVASARAEALAYCNGAPWGACVVVAERRPAGYRGDEGAQTLSQRAIDANRNRPPERALPVVWGLSSDGSWFADQPGEATPANAVEARRKCQALVTGRRGPFFPSRRCVAGMGPMVLIDG